MEKLMVRKLNQKRALVVGCNYPNTRWPLSGCVNDAISMKMTLLERFGFQPDSIKMLMDTPGSPKIPTAATIKAELYSMINGAKSGDALFFYFAGHGTDSPKTSLVKCEAILGSDLNPITSFDFRDIVNRVPKGASFTIMSDSCNSGGLIDKEPVQIGPRHPIQLENEVATVSSYSAKRRIIPHESLMQEISIQTGLNNPDIRVHMLHLFGSDASLVYSLPHHRLPKPLKADQGILLSGCQPDEYSHEGIVDGVHRGVFTIAFQKIVYKIPPANLSNQKIILMAREIMELQNRGDPEDQQHPCLYCSNKNANAIILANLGHP